MKRALTLAGIVLAFSIPVVGGIVLYRLKWVERDEYGDGTGERVLFVGNSITYFNGMPRMVAELSRSAPSEQKYDVTWLSRGGATIADLAGAPRVRWALDEGWHAVVLQPQSLEPVMVSEIASEHFFGARPLWAPDRTEFFGAVTRAATSIRAKGAVPVFFWFVPYHPGHELYRTRPHQWWATLVGLGTMTQVGLRTRSPLALPGLVYGDCQSRADEEGRGIAFIGGDFLHPSVEGSYLIAWTVFSELAPKRPEPSDAWWHPTELAKEKAAWIRECASDWPRWIGPMRIAQDLKLPPEGRGGMPSEDRRVLIEAEQRRRILAGELWLGDKAQAQLQGELSAEPSRPKKTRSGRRSRRSRRSPR